MTKLELKRKILKVLKVFNGREEAIFDICWKEIAEIKKENAELKKEVLEVRQHLELTEREWGKDTVKLYHFKTQLTKAIEIISAFVEWANWQGGECPSFKSIQDEAEQFLKEIEK